MRGLNLDQLQTFLDVVELGSFSAAARKQGLTQPAISLQLRELEKRLGVRLIERIGRKAQPTAAGVELSLHAERIGAAADAALDAMAGHTGNQPRRVRIGTGATASIHLLPPALKALRQRFPTMEITVSTGNAAAIVEAVQENRIDIGLVTLPVSSRSLDIRPLVEDEFVAVFASGAPMPVETTPEILSALQLVLFETGGNAYRLVEGWFAAAGICMKPAMSLGSVEAIKELVAAGLGCAILPRQAMDNERDIRRFNVKQLSPPLSRVLAMVLRTDKLRDRGLRETVKAFERLAK
jgi:DNA-binding transcriptional LysR family regulator